MPAPAVVLCDETGIAKREAVVAKMRYSGVGSGVLHGSKPGGRSQV